MYLIYADGELLYSPELTEEGYALLSIKLTTELNRAGSLEFTMPTSNVMYEKLQKLKTIITVYDGTSEIWRGRVLHEERDFYKRKMVYCEGHLAFFMDAIMRPYSFKGSPGQLFSKLLSAYNEQVEESHRFQISTINVTDPNDYIVRANSDYVTVYNEMMDKLVNMLGGYIHIKKAATYYYIQYLTDPGTISSQVIRFGVNLLDISEFINSENIFTVLIPLGAREETEDGSEGARLTIKSVNEGKDYIVNETAVNLFGKIWRTHEWDDVTLPENLLAKGQAYLEENVSMAITLSIKAVDLHLIDVNTEAIKLGDYIRVVSEPHGLDEYFLCSKIVQDLLSPDKTEFTLGTSLSAMTDEQLAAIKQSKSAAQSAQTAENAASNASAVVVDIAGDYVRKSEFMTYQEQVNSKLTAVYHYKGTVPNYDSLPRSRNTVGDVYNDDATGANYAWTGSTWDKLSETVDLSAYALKSELPSDYVTQSELASLEERVAALEQGNPSEGGEENGG